MKYEIKKPVGMKDSNAYTLYEDGIPVTPLCFGSYDAAFNFFRMFFALNDPPNVNIKPHIDMGEGEE